MLCRCFIFDCPILNHIHRHNGQGRNIFICDTSRMYAMMSRMLPFLNSNFNLFNHRKSEIYYSEIVATIILASTPQQCTFLCMEVLNESMACFIICNYSNNFHKKKFLASKFLALYFVYF